jgi:hypothetical protein
VMKFKFSFPQLVVSFAFLLFSEHLLGNDSEKEDKVNKTSEKTEGLFKKLDEFQSTVNTMMQYTASWLDNFGTDDDNDQKNGASASGYVQFGWIPRTSDLTDLEHKFKVHLSLPNWNNKIALVLDNNDEDELKPDYEADSISQGDDTEELNIAVQFLKTFDNNLNVKYRLGLSRGQVYARIAFKQHWNFEHYKLSIVPRIDYFSEDGWAPSIKGALLYPLENNMLSFSASVQKVQDEFDSRQKIGLYHIYNTRGTEQLVSGIQYYNDKISNESLLLSVRYRNLIYKKWLYIEIEPFIEFNQENGYRKEFGIALRLITFYGSE